MPNKGIQHSTVLDGINVAEIKRIANTRLRIKSYMLLSQDPMSSVFESGITTHEDSAFENRRDFLNSSDRLPSYQARETDASVELEIFGGRHFQTGI